MNAFVNMPASHLIQNMRNSDYHNSPDFSSSQLKDILRSNAHFYAKHIAKEIENCTSEAKIFGSLVHCLFLEPQHFAHEFVVAPKFNRRTKEGKAQAEEWEKAHFGKTLVTDEQIETAQRIVNNLCSLSSYQFMKNEYGMAEASIFFADPVYGLQLRVRPDWHIAPCRNFPNGLILDLKTTKDARQKSFASDSMKYGYDLSAAMYREGFQQYYGTAEKPPFIFLVAENEAPCNVKQYQASDSFLMVGEARYNKAKEQLAESLLINEWDGYSTELEELDLPAYFTKQVLDF